MALEANEVERIYVEVLLGIPRSESLVRMRPEVEQFWDVLSAEVEQMRADGKNFIIPNEFPDVLPTKETEVRFNQQQPRAPDGKWTSGGGGAAAGDTGGDTPGGGAPSGGAPSGGSQVEIDEEIEAMVNTDEYPLIAGDVLLDEQGEYAASLDVPTVEAIKDYSTDGYRSTNRVLRGAPPPPPTGTQARMAKERGELVNEAINNAPPLEGGIISYRGVGANALGLQSSMEAESLIGSTFTDKGIVSTSLQMRTSSGFAENLSNDGVMLELRVPGGSKALYIEEMSSIKDEYEILLPSGTQFTIVDVKRPKYANKNEAGNRIATIVVDVKTP